MFNLIWNAILKVVNLLMFVAYTIMKALGDAVLSLAGGLNIFSYLNQSDTANIVLGWMGYVVNATMLEAFIPAYILLIGGLFVFRRIASFLQLY